MNSNGVAALPAIRVLLVDESPTVREGLALLLAPDGIQVCEEASGRADALARVDRECPDLAVVDLSIDGDEGLALIADLRERAVPVLVYSVCSGARCVANAFAAGALGYVTKREVHGVLVDGIREAALRHRFVSPRAAVALAEYMAESPAYEALRTLSPHERKVFELLGHGEDTCEIAVALHVSNHTVESYYERIKVKLRMSGMHELRRHAIEHFQRHAG